MAYPIHQAMNNPTLSRLAVRTAKKNLENAQAIHAEVSAKFERDPHAYCRQLGAAIDAVVKAEEAYYEAFDAAYPQADIEITSAHVIVRKLGLANLLEADRIVKEQHAAGNLEFTRVFRGEAKRIADMETFELSI